MAARRTKEDEFGRIPKLEPGDKVPRTGKFRLDSGVRVRPVHRYGSSRIRVHPERPRRLGTRRGIAVKRRGRRRRRY